MEKKSVYLKDLINDFEYWLDNYMQSWSDSEIHECTNDCSPVMNDDRELCKFLDEYPQYDMDILDDNRDELEVAIMRVAMSYDNDY